MNTMNSSYVSQVNFLKSVNLESLEYAVIWKGQDSERKQKAVDICRSSSF